MGKGHLRISLLGSNSGRNAGDAAILEAVVRQISRRRPGTVFEVPTTNPDFIRRSFPGKNVIPVSIMPWDLSLRLLGVPVLRSLARCDLSLILDGIIFDHRLLNPAFNFLITLVFLAPFSRAAGRPMVCFEAGIGPLRTPLGRRCARIVGESCDLIMVREDDSARLMREVGVKETPVEIYADAAFVLDPAPAEAVDRILLKLGTGGRPLVGLNLTSYGGQWVKKGRQFDRQAFQGQMASLIDSFTRKTGTIVVLTGTQHMDRDYLAGLKGMVGRQDSVRMVSNLEHTPAELAGLMGRMGFFIGMRLHSLILASSMKTPILGLTYAPKVLSLFRLLERPELALDLGSLEPESLLRSMITFWEEREKEKIRISTLIDRLKEKAQAGFDRLVDLYR